MSNLIRITDLSMPGLDMYTDCNEAQLLHYYEPDGGVFIAESPKVIERALDFGCQPISLLMEEKHVATQGKEILKRCEGVPVYIAELSVLEKITGIVRYFPVLKKYAKRQAGSPYLKML